MCTTLNFIPYDLPKVFSFSPIIWPKGSIMFSHKNCIFWGASKVSICVHVWWVNQIGKLPKNIFKKELGSTHLIDKNILYDLNQIYPNLFSKCAKPYLILDTNIYYVYLSLWIGFFKKNYIPLDICFIRVHWFEANRLR
jgi:hypothetical protein